MVIDKGRIIADGVPHDVMHEPEHEALAQLAGFENFLDGTILNRRPEAGTMQVRLAPSGLDLEVPVSGGTPGAPVRIAIRAGDILLATQEPRGLSARNIVAGRVASLRGRAPLSSPSLMQGNRSSST